MKLVMRAPDLWLGCVLALVNVVSLLQYRGELHPLWGALLLAAGQAVPLGWRRRWPVPVAIVAGACRVSFDAIGYGHAPFPLAPAIALYTVFDRSGCFWRWATVAGTVAGISVSLSTPGHDEPYQAIYQSLIMGTALVAGLLSRSARTSLEAARRRAETAEAVLDTRVREQAVTERTRIARELHDVIAHHVSLVAVQAEAAAALLPSRPGPAAKSVAIIGDTARQALGELRRLLGVLRGPSDPVETEPIASLRALPAMLDSVRSAGLDVSLAVSGAVFDMPSGVDLTAYRIIAEALTNTIRHSSAGGAAVSLSYEPGFVTVSVTESGERPTGSRVAVNGSGLGLAGIAERVAACGGHLAIGPSAEDGGGFAVTAKLPV